MEETYPMLIKIIDIAEKANIDPAKLMGKISFFIKSTPEIPLDVEEKVHYSEMMVRFLAKNEKNEMAYQIIKMLLEAIKEYI